MTWGVPASSCCPGGAATLHWRCDGWHRLARLLERLSAGSDKPGPGRSISVTLRFLVNLIAFWTFDVRGYIGLYLVVASLFCGLFIPVHLFQVGLQVVAYATPFPSMLQTPIDVLSGWARLGCRGARCQSARLAGGSRRPCETGAVAAGRRLVVQGG